MKAVQANQLERFLQDHFRYLHYAKTQARSAADVEDKDIALMEAAAVDGIKPAALQEGQPPVIMNPFISPADMEKIQQEEQAQRKERNMRFCEKYGIDYAEYENAESEGDLMKFLAARLQEISAENAYMGAIQAAAMRKRVFNNQGKSDLEQDWYQRHRAGTRMGARLRQAGSPDGK